MSISRIAICMVLLGAISVVVAHSIPQFSNGFNQEYLELIAHDGWQPGENWSASYDRYMTLKRAYENPSHGMFLRYGYLLLSLSAFVMIFSFFQDLKQFRDLKNLKSLRSKVASLVTVNVAWLGLVHGLAADIYLDARVYSPIPSWDDAWMKGGAVGVLFLDSVGLAIVNLIALAILYRAKLPVPLLQKLPSTGLGRFWFVIVFLSNLLLGLLFFLGMACGLAFSVPFILLWIYIVTGTKAVLASRLKSLA